MPLPMQAEWFMPAPWLQAMNLRKALDQLDTRSVLKQK